MVTTKTRFHETLGNDIRNARRDYRNRDKGAAMVKVLTNVREAFRQGHLKLEEISIRGLFEAIVPNGREMVTGWGHGGGSSAAQLFYEAEAVKTTDFSNIMLLAISGHVMSELQTRDLIHDQVTTTMQTSLEMERIPGIGGLGDVAKVIDEGQPYPLAGLGAEWIDTPATKKRGFIVPVTKEAIFFDRTSLVQKRASDTAKWMLINKEKRVLSVVAGVTNNYKWMDQTYNTYQNGGGGELYDNTAGSNGFVDWRSYQAAENLLSNIRDPLTGEPVNMGEATTVICSPEMAPHHRRVLGASEIRHDTNPSAGTEGVVTISSNPISGKTVLASRYFADQIGNTTSWIYGRPKDAFIYMQNWGITTDTAGSDSSLGFANDVIFQAKISERGAAGVMQPRCVVINNQ